MPNHVHVLIKQMEGHRLCDIIHAWKSFTAKEANKRLGTAGLFWAPDYFDRYIRDQAHFDAVVRYIQENPVKAGLVAHAGECRWSSAWDGR
jgi:REP element-mobilizing transposase RayT